MRSEVHGTKLVGNVLQNGNRLGVNKQGISAQIVLTADSPPIQVLTPTVDCDVLLPDETLESSKGLFFLIYNDAAAASTFDLIVKENDDSTTVDTLTEQQGSLIFCDGTQWVAIRGAAT